MIAVYFSRFFTNRHKFIKIFLGKIKDWNNIIEKIYIKNQKLFDIYSKWILHDTYNGKILNQLINQLI
jgi:hypothetical protein